jgi:hypothetical protein
MATALPAMALVQQKYQNRALGDVFESARKALEGAPWRDRVRAGMRVGVGAGSRGISNYAVVVRAVCDSLRALGAEVFIFPCMGSHGGATSSGQLAVLHESGITTETMGVPILSEIEPMSLGPSLHGRFEVFMDANAFKADAFVVVNRVKWHTDFGGAIESGLMKMMAMGIGKHRGAQVYHNYAIRGRRHEEAIRESAGTVLKTGRCLGGVAILEDAYHHTAAIEPVAAADLPAREQELLALVKGWAPSLQVDGLDLLIVDRMGKDFSGSGMDTKVVNRSVHGEANVWPGTRVERLYVRDLSSHSYGNAVGIGMAEGVSRRLADKIDWHPTRVNALTASTPRNIRLPLIFDNDREAVTTLLGTVGLATPLDGRIGWIRNTLEIARLAVSLNVLPELRQKIECEVIEDHLPLEFTDEGELLSPWEAEQAVPL